MIYETAPAGFSRVKLAYGPYSPSRLIVAKCPQRFYGQYIRKDQSVTNSVAAARGSAIHEILEKITKKHVAHEPILIDEFNNWVSEAIGKFPAAYEEAGKIKKAAGAYAGNPSPYITNETQCEMAFAVEMWEKDTFDNESVKETIFIKAPYEIDGKTNPNVYFGGRLDQVTVDHSVKTVTILDHKSTPSASKSFDHIFQLGCYAWLVSLFYPGYSIKTVIHFADPGLNFYKAAEIWDEESLLGVAMEIHTKISAVERRADYDPVPGSGCDYCHMAQECKIWLQLQEQRARGAVNLNANCMEDLSRLAGAIEVAEIAKKELQVALKDGMEKLHISMVPIEGMIYYHKPSEESVDWIATDIALREEGMRSQRKLEDHYPDGQEKTDLEFKVKTGSLDKLMATYGIDGEAFKSWNGSKLKQLFKLDKPQFFEKLRPFLVKDKSTKFGGYKA